MDNLISAQQRETISLFLSVTTGVTETNVNDRLMSAKALNTLAEMERQKHDENQDVRHLGRAEAFTEAALALLAEKEAA